MSQRILVQLASTAVGVMTISLLQIVGITGIGVNWFGVGMGIVAYKWFLIHPPKTEDSEENSH